MLRTPRPEYQAPRARLVHFAVQIKLNHGGPGMFEADDAFEARRGRPTQNSRGGEDSTEPIYYARDGFNLVSAPAQIMGSSLGM